jgi:WD40 repeat protein
LYLTGVFENAIDVDPSRQTHQITSAGDYDAFVAAFSTLLHQTERFEQRLEIPQHAASRMKAWPHQLNLLHTLSMPPAPVRGLAYSGDGQWLAAASDQRSIVVWSTTDWNVGRAFAGLEGKAHSLAWAPDRPYLACTDGTLRVFDVIGGRQLWQHRASADFTELHAAEAYRCAFSPDGRLVGAGYKNGTVILFLTESGQVWRVMQPHRGQMRSLAFLPDGRTLATAGMDQTIRLWNTKTGLELMSFSEPHHVYALAFSTDGNTLAAALHDGTIKLWRAGSRND